jgi:nucleotide-binding universal stress UspA family protein
MYKRILVPLDGSPFAEHALPAAIAISRLTNAAVHLVRVHEPSSTSVPTRVVSASVAEQVACSTALPMLICPTPGCDEPSV